MSKEYIIPEKIYHGLWNEAIGNKKFDVYFKNVSHRKEYQYLLNMDFDEAILYSTLLSIHKLAHLPISELLEFYNIKNIALSHKLCIPIKTVEHWKYGDRECPPYMKLVILKAFGIKYLPDNVFIVDSTRPKSACTIKPHNSSSEDVSDSVNGD